MTTRPVEESIDLTPGVVWTDAQLEVVKQLLVRAHLAEAKVRRLWVLLDEIDGDGSLRMLTTDAVRAALDR